jgi:hypothetical protein
LRIRFAELTKIYINADGMGWNVPPFRRPTKKNIENIFPAFRRRERLAKNSFEALGIFAQKNSDRVFMLVLLFILLFAILMWSSGIHPMHQRLFLLHSLVAPQRITGLWILPFFIPQNGGLDWTHRTVTRMRILPLSHS